MPRRDQFSSHEKYIEWYRKYRAKHREKIRAYNRVYNKNWRKIHGYYNEEAWKKRNPEKIKAHQLVAKAIRIGFLKRGLCRRCKAKNTHAHHTDYSQPLKIVWLCPIHHAEAHKRIRNRMGGDKSIVKKNNIAII